ncbi:hypothetical protein Q5E69_009910 [Acinetobacter baumannii]
MLSVEMPTTYYTTTKKYDLHFPNLEDDIDVDVVIIGGGFSGVNTGLELIERGIKSIAILETNYIGFGGQVVMVAILWLELDMILIVLKNLLDKMA